MQSGTEFQASHNAACVVGHELDKVIQYENTGEEDVGSVNTDQEEELEEEGNVNNDTCSIQDDDILAAILALEDNVSHTPATINTTGTSGNDEIAVVIPPRLNKHQRIIAPAAEGLISSPRRRRRKPKGWGKNKGKGRVGRSTIILDAGATSVPESSRGVGVGGGGGSGVKGREVKINSIHPNGSTGPYTFLQFQKDELNQQQQKTYFIPCPIALPILPLVKRESDAVTAMRSTVGKKKEEKKKEQVSREEDAAVLFPPSSPRLTRVSLRKQSANTTTPSVASTIKSDITKKLDSTATSTPPPPPPKRVTSSLPLPNAIPPMTTESITIRRSARIILTSEPVDVSSSSTTTSPSRVTRSSKLKARSPSPSSSPSSSLAPEPIRRSTRIATAVCSSGGNGGENSRSNKRKREPQFEYVVKKAVRSKQQQQREIEDISSDEDVKVKDAVERGMKKDTDRGEDDKESSSDKEEREEEEEFGTRNRRARTKRLNHVKQEDDEEESSTSIKKRRFMCKVGEKPRLLILPVENVKVAEGPNGINGIYVEGEEGRKAVAAAIVASIAPVADGKGGLLFQCPRPMCAKQYNHSNGLKYHLTKGSCEMDHFVAASLNGGAAVGPDMRVVYRPYTCKVDGCGKRYQNNNGLRYHGEHSHPDLNFATEVYSLGF
ncbi:UNVERIFIED_CONTAM: hypothetical protein HDU68_005001 [Siphonaria sp. JEL0065]|nr:hypothetical protein HDU68_005001 [Siphonaria sp. JEL0065]